MKTIKIHPAIYFIAILISSFSCEKQFDFPEDQVEKFTLMASESNHSYQIYVGLPEGYDAQRSDTYPVIYLLDADWDFDRVAEMAGEEAPKIQEAAIVVGIGYPNDENERQRDYTPSQDIWDEAGQADAFITFIQEDLIPEIEKQYHVQTTAEQRLIIGHSLGGLFGTYLFLTRPDLFSHYLILSPSLWWDNQAIFETEEAQRTQLQEHSAHVFMGIGEMEGFGMNPTFNLFSERFKEFYPLVDLSTWRVDGKGHNDSKPENLQKGLQFFYENL